MANAPEDAHLDGDNLSQPDSAAALIAPAAPSRRSNSRALKVAGLTTLACLLIVSQIVTAYMVIDQSKQISSLKKKSEEVGKQLTRTMLAQKAPPMKMQPPLGNTPLVMDIELDHQQPQPTPAKPVSLTKTKCQIEAEPENRKLGTYEPQCDEQGRFKPMQCWMSTGYCWCVDETGKVIDGTTVKGRASCQQGQALGHMSDGIMTSLDG